MALKIARRNDGLTQQDIDKVLRSQMPEFDSNSGYRLLLRWGFRIGYRYAKGELQ